MNRPTPVSDILVQRHLRLHLTLSGRCDRMAVQRFGLRLDAYLRGTALLYGLSPTTLEVMTEGRDIHPLERALLVTWLTQQPEVVLVRLCPSRSTTKGGSHGQA